MGATRVGKTLGNFRILECLGSGGAGMIWKAEDLSLGRIVALKALRPELASDSDMAQRFRAEARTLAKLSHANIASLFSLIEDDDGLFLVLECVDGNTLASLLATSGPLPLDSAFALFHQVLDGVGHAHDAGIVHRDLKPSNLMVDARGRVKVMDFGIARVAGVARTTHHGKLVGTPEYMSPEQVRGEDATIRSDLYSLGIVLFEMLTGRPPFRASASFELMRAQIEDAPPDPRALRPELDARVATALLRALAKRPAERFATTRELQDVLLDAGASRRGRTIAPIWREIPPSVSASEAPTLGTNAAELASASAPTQSEAELVRAQREAQEPERGAEAPEVWTDALDALDEDIDAAFAGVNDAHPNAAARAAAPTTRVMDSSQDTSVLEAARPTRMLEGAPFAAHARSLAAKPASAPPAQRTLAWLWALAAASLIALAFGVIRLRAHGEVVTPAPPTRAPALAPSAAEAPEPRVATPEPAPLAHPEREPKPASAPVRAQPKKKPAATPGDTEPAPQREEESGWVIRR